MKKYNFDELIVRTNTNSIKYDFSVEREKPEGLIPLWVADMDFRAPTEVIDALVKKSTHGIFGYSDTKLEYFDTLKRWYSTHFQWNIHSDWLVKTPGIVYAISTAVRGLTNVGDSIMIQRPVYYPFSTAILNNNRKLVNNPLVYKDGKYSIDFDDFENKIINEKVKLFILCNPHNPVGKVWSNDDLIRMGEICVTHNVIVVSDEIHADFIHPGFKHTIFANIKPEFREISITCTSPSKTFNLAGLQISNIFIPNEEIRTQFKEEYDRTGYSQLNIMGLIACQAAYLHGSDWLLELNKYIYSNITFTREFIKDRIPKLKLIEPEGTYLLWIDFNSLGLTNEELEDLIIHKAGLWLDNGLMFGEEGFGFQRMNIACPRSTLESALTKLEFAIQNHSIYSGI